MGIATHRVMIAVSLTTNASMLVEETITGVRRTTASPRGPIVITLRHTNAVQASIVTNMVATLAGPHVRREVHRVPQVSAGRAVTCAGHQVIVAAVRVTFRMISLRMGLVHDRSPQTSLVRSIDIRTGREH